MHANERNSFKLQGFSKYTLLTEIIRRKSGDFLNRESNVEKKC